MSFLATHLVGFAAGGNFSAATAVFSATLDTHNAGGHSVSYRQICAVATAGTQIRVQFGSHSSGVTDIDNASVGIQSSVVATTAVPSELKFSGASGFSISAGATIWSDWLDFTQAGSGNVVVVMDMGDVTNIRFDDVSTSGGVHQRAAYNSYNEANPASFTLAGINSSFMITSVEVRSAV
jgi:hypothetical protein